MKGVFGRILSVDVRDRSFEVRELSPELYRNLLGGKGIGAYLLLNYIPPGTDPLGPDNCLIFTAGPLAGSSVHGSNRYGVFFKSPLTLGYGESYSGGNVAYAIKRTGYDAVLIRGASPAPVFLEISKHGVVFHDAGDIWGLDTYAAQDRILNAVSVPGSQAVVIGPAGENLVRFACIENNYWRSAGRAGAGAVMGSKKIKGIAFHGDSTISAAEPGALMEWMRSFTARAVDSPAVKSYRNYGTPALVAVMNTARGFPTRYWEKGELPGWEGLSAERLLSDYDVKAHSCPPCLMACGKMTRIRSGKYAGLQIEGPEYETIYSFGGLCEIGDMDGVIRLNDLCDRLGMDTISAGNVIGFVLAAARDGHIDLDVRFGDAEGVISLVKKIAFRQGIGDRMAEGIRVLARDLGLAGKAVHVKGMEPAGYDPRRLKGMALAYGTSARGACHLRTTFYKAELSGMLESLSPQEKVELFVDWENRLALYDCLILCRFYRDLIDWKEVAELISLVAGLQYNREELVRIASGVIDLTRRFNLREGIGPEQDGLPQVFFRPLEPGGHVLDEKEYAEMLSAYYRLRGWDGGVPKLYGTGGPPGFIGTINFR